MNHQPRRTIQPAPRVSSARMQHGADFERFVEQMASDLGRASAKNLDTEIQRQLGRTVRRFGCDRGSIAQLLPDGSPPQVIHVWAREGVTPVPSGVHAPMALPWLLGRIKKGVIVNLPSIDALPASARQDRAFAIRQGVKSHVAIPMRVHEVVYGSLNCATMKRVREWDETTIRRLTIIANLLAAAIWRRWAYEQIDHANADARNRAGALMAKEVTASLAHELSQPLTAILNNAEAAIRFLAAPELEPEEVRDALRAIVRDDHRAAEIVRTVRGLVEGSAAKKAPIKAFELIKTAEEVLRQDALRRRVSLRIDLDGNLPSICGNQTQLLQAVINLIVNAFEAIDEKPENDRRVLIKAFQQGNETLISITDSGHGIAPEIAKTLFDPFVTSKPDGMGMGLAIASSVIRDHGGALTAESIPGKGATFTIALPFSNAQET